jgi:hypothetical protein
MLITIDAMAKRYGLLPSQIMEQASTFDMVIMDAALSYEVYLEQQHRAKSGFKMPAESVPQEQLNKLWEQRK